MMFPLQRCCLLLFALFVAARAEAQLAVEVTRGSTQAIPVAVVPFADTALAGGTDPAAVVAADLDRSGRFRTLPRAELLEQPSTAAQVDAAHWRLLKVDYVVVGRLRALMLPDIGRLRASEGRFRALEVRPDAVVHVISLDDDLVDLVLEDAVDGVEDLGLGDAAVGVLDEELEDAALAARQRHRLAVDLDIAAVEEDPPGVGVDHADGHAE